MLSPALALHLVGPDATARAEAVRAAGCAAGLGGVVHHWPNLAAAIAAPPAGTELLVLLDAKAEDSASALAARDARGLPRWAVVPQTADRPLDPASARAQWEVPMLTQSMHSALCLLALRRENARLRGDLCTVGRRLMHDLRTPLNTISMSNEALAEGALAAGSNPTLHRSISAAVEEAGALMERIGTVLFASGRPVERQLCDMEEPVWNARQRLDTRLRAAGATIVAPEKWPEVNGAPALLELVWDHLLANSVQHGGVAPRIELGWTRSPAHIRFWVRDSGPGVAVAKRSRLFHPIDRLSELNAPRGYGLPLVQRLVELHNGTVGYDPDPVPAGTFYFVLPAIGNAVGSGPP